MFWIFVLLLFPCLSQAHFDPDLVVENRQIHLPNYPRAWNPSIVPFEQGYLLSFRYTPNPGQDWLSFIGVVILDASLKPISQPQLLDTRVGISSIPSHSEDARLFWFQDKLYLFYNDNLEETYHPGNGQHRDMFMSELSYENGRFMLSAPKRLIYPEKRNLWEKNWAPFVWNNQLHFVYQITPHEILKDDIPCSRIASTRTPTCWKWGPLRGGTPALLVDGEYLAFFHSSTQMHSDTANQAIKHYLMGAYTFSSTPPFEVTKISANPITAKEFYQTQGWRVVFPGGYVVSEPYIHVSYGKANAEIWIVTIDKSRLMSSLVPLRRGKL